MIVATSSGAIASRRAAACAGSTPRPARSSSATAPASIVTIRRRCGSEGRRASTRPACSEVSTIAKRTRESEQIQATCSSEEVS